MSGHESQPDEPVDVTSLSEPELIEIIADLPLSISPLGEAAMDEYLKRRAEAINRGLAARALEQSRTESGL